MVQSRAQGKAREIVAPTQTTLSPRVKVKLGPLNATFESLAKVLVAGPHRIKVQQGLKSSGFYFQFFC
jgi:hypothetical protein